MDGQFFFPARPPEAVYMVVLASGGKPYAELFACLRDRAASGLSGALARRRRGAGGIRSPSWLAPWLPPVGIPVVHHEAGLRSRDLHIGGEYHWIIVDHMSDILCAPRDDAMPTFGTKACRRRACA